MDYRQWGYKESEMTECLSTCVNKMNNSNIIRATSGVEELRILYYETPELPTCSHRVVCEGGLTLVRYVYYKL